MCDDVKTESSAWELHKGMFSYFSLEEVEKSIRWEQRDAPRAEAYYADQFWPYTYGRGAGERQYWPMTEWPPVLLEIRGVLTYLLKERYEMLFCNMYCDEHQHLGWHADDSASVDPARGIPVVSFGEAREIWVRPYASTTDVQKILLEHGDLFFMRARMQQTHQHRIPKGGRKMDTRVSLTFRGYKP
jgi:alkylated DNA repair dioxygenase AlkB